jgi:hypothetical protein
MRYHEGDYAYEIEPVRNTATQLFSGWRYNVYRTRPDELVDSGQAATQEEAERSGRRMLASIIRAESQQ